VVVIVVVVTVRMALRMVVRRRPAGRCIRVDMIRAARQSMRVAVCVAGTAMLVAVAAGPVPVLAHGSRIRRLALPGQRVKPIYAICRHEFQSFRL